MQKVNYGELELLWFDRHLKRMSIHGFHFIKIPVCDVLCFLFFFPHLYEVKDITEFHSLEYLNQAFFALSDTAFGEWVPASRLSCSVSFNKIQPVCVGYCFSTFDAHVYEITGHP
ncbi:hypothetical protein N9L38_01925 [Candidatus Poseidoniales archaeon]|nr:hypothetical protein [Candidatus Poseidoniales archaeon]